MADRNLNDPNDPQLQADDERPTWDVSDQTEPDEQPDLIDPTPQESDARPDESEPTFPEATDDPTLSEAPAEDLTIEPTVEESTIDPHAYPSDGLPVDEGASVLRDDREIPRDVLERRQLPDDGYERRREVPVSTMQSSEPVESDVAPEDSDHIEIDYSKWQEDDAPAQEPPISDDAPATDDSLGTTDAAVGAGALGAGAAGAAGAAATMDDDLETTKVRRQSLLNPEEQPPTDGEATSSWHPREAAQSQDDAEISLFDDATVVPEVPSRVGARVWSFFLTLIGLPAAWYLITDAAARLTLADGNPVATGMINPAALLELGGGAVVAIILILLTIRSSLGALIFGFLAAVAGGFFLAVPQRTADFMEPAYNWLTAFNDFGGNVAHHIQWTGYTGAMLIAGLMFFVFGLAAIFARRDGRREQDIRAQIERMAPGTLKKGRRKKA
ncbi:MAG: hypothetical protein Q4D87_04585 [Actinomycetaceae bacterium]|nr:hypothetical protein [Actinomycetaceae bacterium]